MGTVRGQIWIGGIRPCKIHLSIMPTGHIGDKKTMRLGLLIACPAKNIDKVIADVQSLGEKYDARVVFFLKSYSEIRLIEKKQEEV